MKNNKLNILFLASWYPNKITPKNGNFIQKHAEAVAAYCNIFALHIIARKQSEDFVIETTLNNNVSETIIYYKKVTTKIPIVHHILKLLIRRKAHNLGYQEILKKANKIDIVHLNVCFPAGLFALHLKNKYKLPYIISENWTFLLDSNPNKFSFIEQYFVNKINRNADMLCPVSMDLKKSLVKIAPNQNYSIVPNVVNTQIFKPTFSSNQNEKVKILHLSNLKDEHKNITGIINVIGRLSKIRTDFELTIAGDGDAEKYQEQIKKLNIPVGIILFEGEQTTVEVAQLMNKSDLFLLFSNYETFSVVVAEAWVCGIPVITSICGGITNEVTPENGLQVPTKDEDTLLEKLNEIIENIDSYDKNEIAEKAINMYSYEAVGKQFYDIYTKILSV